jgi:hypothetical protein
MIELVHILRVIVEETACGGEGRKSRCSGSVPPIKFSELEHLVHNVLWQEERIAIYSTSWTMSKELERCGFRLA